MPFPRGYHVPEQKNKPWKEGNAGLTVSALLSFFDLSPLGTMRHRTGADKQLKGECDEDPPSRVTAVAAVVPGFFDPGSQCSSGWPCTQSF